MGDRRQVIFEFGLPNQPENEQFVNSIVLYTHWGGSDLPNNLAQAILTAKPRWRDDNYFTRIVVSQIVNLDWNEETGFGLDIHYCDSEYADFFVNLPNQTVRLGIQGKEMTFQEFIDTVVRDPDFGGYK